MTKEKFSLYITDPEAYINGDRDYSLTTYSTEMFTKHNTPEDWIYLGEIESPKPPSREKLLEKAVERLNIEDKKIDAEAGIRKKAVDNRRQRLLALPPASERHDV